MKFIQARVYSGMWIADCERPGCNSAQKLAPLQTEFCCINCQWTCLVEWPRDAVEITEVLNLRPIPHTRNWFPKNHWLAINQRCPHGQTVADLIAENKEHGVM